MACGVTMVASELSMSILYLLERDGWELFGELVSWLVTKGRDHRVGNKVRYGKWHLVA